MAFNPEKLLPSTMPFYKCAHCERNAWREGGIGSALQHLKQYHDITSPDAGEDYVMEARRPLNYKPAGGRVRRATACPTHGTKRSRHGACMECRKDNRELEKRYYL